MSVPCEVPILIQHENDRPYHWERFVAVLCFMEFYVTFVYAGVTIWDENNSLFFGPLAVVLQCPWTRIPLLVGAVLLYLAGRGLWRGGGSARNWLWLGIAGLLFMVSCEVVAMTGWISDTSAALAPRPAAPIGRALLAGFMCASVHFVLLAVMIVGAWLTRPQNRLLQSTKAPWTICAAAFCLISIPSWLFGHDSTIILVGYELAIRTGNLSFILVASLASAVLLLATASALLYQWRLARTGALILAAANLVVVWYNWYPISMLVRLGIRALMLSMPPTADIDERIWTQHDFVCLFVDPVHLVGPWLLIAIYAWRVPMHKPPNDGTPFPRRFCRNCYYNLRGIEVDRCPECGFVLVTDPKLEI